MVSTHCLSVLLLSEDSAGDSHDTLRALAKKMAQLVVPGCQTQRIDLQPQPERAARAMHGNAWKGKRHFALIDLGQTIATKILEDTAPGFVLFHFDGDRRWSLRATSENTQKFQDFVQHYVEPHVDGILIKRGTTEEKTARMTRLRRLVPFYSIEAWLYQNTEEAARICLESGCGQHLELYSRWAAERAILDEIDQPKREEVSCLRAVNNRRLAENAFPVEAAFGADCSFAAAVMELLECDALCAALGRTVEQ